MSDVWITSDTHWGHTNIIRYAERPFADTEEMDKALFRGWRETVKGNDTIIHLGDVCFKWNKERTQNIITNLPGRKILIMGNHDRSKSLDWWRDVGFDEVYPYPIIYNKWYILSHEEVFLNGDVPYINIHGHWHQTKLNKPYYINVCVENTGYKPVLFNSIIPKPE